METSGPTSAAPLRPVPIGGSAGVSWRPGQLLQATVTESATGRVLLAIGHRQLSAETSLPLHKGQQLTLQVQSLGQQPVLRIIPAATDSTLAATMRLLLPRQGAMTPLLSSLSQLAAAPRAPVPVLVKELARVMVRQLPTVATASTAQGLKRALQESGVFLERHLFTPPAAAGAGSPAAADFKANLLRLLQLLRNWPADRQPVTTHRPPAAGPPPAASAPAGVATPSATPDQLQRAVKPAPFGGDQGGQPSAHPSQASTPAVTSGERAGRSAAAAAAQQAPPPTPAPLRGSAPLPQSALQTTLDLLNRSGNLRTDLLQQTEAALARVQLSQLAALPRDGERGVLEWLFELPLRRGDDLDLWSLRLWREPPDQEQPGASPTPLWSIQLAFDLPGLGPMQAQLQIAGQQVSTHFVAEQPATLSLLREHLPDLRQALAQLGLQVAELDCRRGQLQADAPGDRPPLISEKA